MILELTDKGVWILQNFEVVEKFRLKQLARSIFFRYLKSLSFIIDFEFPSSSRVQMSE